MWPCEMNFFKDLDLRDVFFVMGLGLLGYGVYRIDPSISFILVGAILFIISVLSMLRGSKR